MVICVYFVAVTLLHLYICVILQQLRNHV